MKSKASQRLIVRESDVPAGYVPLSNFGQRKAGAGGPREYELLHAAYQSQRIDAVKLMRTPRDQAGPVFIDESQAKRLIAADKNEPVSQKEFPQAAERRSEIQPATARQVESLCESLAGIDETLALLLTAVGRLATVAESLTDEKSQSGDFIASVDCNTFSCQQ